MTQPLRLILFDVDGTLVDSQGSIIAAMDAAFADLELVSPRRDQVLSIVGLSLDQAMARLVPDQPVSKRDQLVQAYKDAYSTQRAQSGSATLSPLYPGARAMLEHLAAVPENLLGVATGKSQRGLDGLLEDHDLKQMFVTRQVADHHPSKPHPSMIMTAMSETGVDASDTVMIGDTSFDMDMARAAGVTGVGVSWGYHAATALQSRTDHVITQFDDLPHTLNKIWTVSA